MVYTTIHEYVVISLYVFFLQSACILCLWLYSLLDEDDEEEDEDSAYESSDSYEMPSSEGSDSAMPDEEEDVREDEHDYEKEGTYARRMSNTQNVRQVR